PDQHPEEQLLDEQHFSDGTVCVWRWCLPPWPMRAASALRKTRHQCTGRRATPVTHLLLLSLAEVAFTYCSSRLQSLQQPPSAGMSPRNASGLIPCGDHLEPRGSAPNQAYAHVCEFTLLLVSETRIEGQSW